MKRIFDLYAKMRTGIVLACSCGVVNSQAHVAQQSINAFSLFENVMVSRALFVAADLGIAEHLQQVSMTVGELAQVTKTHGASLARLLYFLEVQGVFRKNDAGHYENTEFSKTMCADHPHTIKPFLLHDDATRWNAFGHLGDSIATGKASFDKLYGCTYFESLEKNPQVSKRFDEAMTIISQQEDTCIAETLSFHGNVADIGGGKGQLMQNIIQNNPSVTGILFDLPQVISQLDNGNNLYIKVAGSFFEPITITADIFVLKRILHDWDDEKALCILNNVSAAMASDSTLYIIEGILDQSHNKKLLAAVDLGLLTIFGGQERMLNDFVQLLDKANLQITRVVQIDGMMCALECRKRAL